MATEPTFRLEPGEDGIARLVVDRPGERVNFLSHATLEELDALLGEVEARVARERIRVLLVRSGKPGSFVAGADLDEMREVADAAEGTAHARRGQQVLRRLEQLPVPTMAVVNGSCLGAGAELALACSYRLASTDPRTRIGFPEVTLGILPALGGTVRLPRLIGVREALELILTGKSVDAGEAHRLGLVDAVFAPEALDEGALRFARERIERGRTRTGARRGVGRRLLEDTAPGRRVVFARLGRSLARAEEMSPAARRALATVADGVALPLDRAFEREAEALGELIVTREARGLLHAFRLRQAARSGPLSPPAAVERVAVLGAGRTGAAVAHLLASRGVPVRLRDVRHAALTEGMERLRLLFREAGPRARREVGEGAELVSGTLGFGGFGTVDVVVEAVPENVELKRAALREVEEHVREECVLASTTAAIPVSELQMGLERPGRVAGMHFLHPVGWTPLVEVVRGVHTSDATVATLHTLARRIGRVPLVVRDGPGFLVNRLLAPYLCEAIRLLEEGAAPERIDGAMTEFGMPVGPLRLLDELGIGFAARLARFLADGLDERLAPPPLLARLAEARGPEPSFYRYAAGKEPRPDPRTRELLRGLVASSATEVPADEAQSRMVLAMVGEAARALEDGIVEGAAEVDLAMTLGVGFPPFRGGLLFHADRVGIPALVATLDEYAARLGDRFAPAPLLRRLATEGRGFYDLAAGSGQAGEGVLR